METKHFRTIQLPVSNRDLGLLEWIQEKKITHFKIWEDRNLLPYQLYLSSKESFTSGITVSISKEVGFLLKSYLINNNIQPDFFHDLFTIKDLISSIPDTANFEVAPIGLYKNETFLMYLPSDLLVNKQNSNTIEIQVAYTPIYGTSKSESEEVDYKSQANDWMDGDNDNYWNID